MNQWGPKILSEGSWTGYQKPKVKACGGGLFDSKAVHIIVRQCYETKVLKGMRVNEPRPKDKNMGRRVDNLNPKRRQTYRKERVSLRKENMEIKSISLRKRKRRGYVYRRSIEGYFSSSDQKCSVETGDIADCGTCMCISDVEIEWHDSDKKYWKRVWFFIQLRGAVCNWGVVIG